MERERQPSPAPPLLHAAAAKGDAEAVRQLLAEGAKVAGTDEANGWTPLHYAAYTGNIEAAKALIEAKASVTSATPNARITPLILAAHSSVDVVALLLDRGMSVGSRDAKGNTALHAANSFKTRQLLIARGAAADTVNGEGITPLHIACAALDVESVALLLSNGAIVNTRAKDGSTAFTSAATASGANVSKQVEVMGILQLFGAKGGNNDEKEQLDRIGRVLAEGGNDVAVQKAEIIKAYKIEMAGAQTGKATVAAAAPGAAGATPEQERIAQGALQTGERYKAAGRADLARAKYESIIIQYPKTQAAGEAGRRLAGPDGGKQ